MKNSRIKNFAAVAAIVLLIFAILVVEQSRGEVALLLIFVITAVAIDRVFFSRRKD